MLSLNLLSQEQKQTIKQRKINLFIRQVTLYLLILSTFLSVLFVFSKKTLENNFTQLARKETNAFGFDSQINKINSYALFLNQVQNNYVSWSKYLIELSQKTPENIKLSSIQINKKEASILINGWAARREEFLIFKNNLENSPLFKNLDSPVQNIAERENINFSLKAGLNLRP